MSSDLPFEIHTKRGPDHDKLIDFVVLAEFDIDTGSTVRHQYPHEIPGYKADWFAEFMLPEGAHNRQLDYTYIFLNREDKQIDEDIWIKPPSRIHNPLLDDISKEDSKFFLYGINLVKTRHDSSVRRGAIVKAMCVFSRYHYVEVFKKPLDVALEKYFNGPSVDVLKSLYESLNAIDLSLLEKPNFMQQNLMRRGVHHETYLSTRPPSSDHLPQSWYRSIEFQYLGDSSPEAKFPLYIPLFQTPDEVGDISLTALVKTFGENVMRIFHAILMRQRVLFVGYNHAASDVAQMVLSAVAMVAPPMTNLIKRTYPYANLSDLSFLEVKGYISGVTNPMFQQRDTWWDLLCVLDLPNGTGTITSAEERRSEDSTASSKGSLNSPGGPSSGGGGSGGGSSHGAKVPYSYEDTAHYAVDNRFIVGVLSGINAKLGETWVRQQFYDYISAIVNHTQDRSILSNNFKVDEKFRKFVDANAARVAVLYSSPEFKAMPQHPWVWCTDCDLMSDHESAMVELAAQQQAESRTMTPIGGTRSSSPLPSGMSTPTGRSAAAAAASAAGADSPSRENLGIAFKEEADAESVATDSTPQAYPPNAAAAVMTRSSHAHSTSATYRDISSPLPPLSGAMHTPPSSSSGVGNMDAIASTAAALFSAPRKMTDRHKDKGSLMKSYIRKLQHEINLTSIKEVQHFFQHMDRHLRTESALQALLVMTPESTGGLLCIASGLFHINPVVRFSATQILTRVKEYASTRCAFHSLNRMFLSAYERQLQKIASGVLQKEMEEAAVEVSVDELLSSQMTLDRNNLFANASSPSSAAAAGSDSGEGNVSHSSDLPPLASIISSTLDGLVHLADGLVSGVEADSTGSERKGIAMDELDLLP